MAAESERIVSTTTPNRALGRFHTPPNAILTWRVATWENRWLGAGAAGGLGALNDRLALATIKVLHTTVFAAVALAVVIVAWDGIRQRPHRRTAMAAAIALGESAVYVGNGFTCPLTPIAERLGAESGSVADIYLPGWFARRLPVIAGSVFASGLVLSIIGLIRGRAS